MKKMYKYILIITLMMFGFIGEVRAADEFRTLCTYEDSDEGETLKVGSKYDESNEMFKYSFFVNDEAKTYLLGNAPTEREKEIVEKLKGGVCPGYIYEIESTFSNPGKPYCLDDGDNLCSTENPNRTIKAKKKLKMNNMEEFENDVGVHIPQNVDINSCVDEGSCYALCYYSTSDNSDYSFIYYFPGEDKFKTSFSWKGNDKVYDLQTDSGTAFIGPVERDNLRNAICPVNVYKDKNLSNEICFDSDGEYCVKQLSGHFDTSEKLSDISVSTLLNSEELKALMPVDNNLSCKEAVEKVVEYDSGVGSINQICVLNVNGLINNVNQFFIVNVDQKYRFFKYSGSVENIKMEEINKNYTSEIKYNTTCNKYAELYYVKYYDEYGNLFNSYYSESKGYATPGLSQPSNTLYQLSCSLYPDSGNSGGGVIDIKDCQSLLGVDLVNEINAWLLYIKIAVPIIIIVMGSIDFGSAFIASDEDKMKKAQKKFIMRLIIGMAIFFLPVIINALLNIANQVWGISNGTCGITF